MQHKIGCKASVGKIGILLAQLGTPDAPETGALRRYLAEFLSDPRVIEKNPIIWKLILHGIILRVRPARSAALYRRIWQPDGSPLLRTTLRQAELLAEKLGYDLEDFEISVGMRYGKPSIGASLDELAEKGCSRILVLPLYPQYAGATTGSTCDAVGSWMQRTRFVPALRIAEPFFAERGYLDAFASRINETLTTVQGPVDKLLISYHGLPTAYVQKGDPYCCMCTATTQGLLPRLSLPPEKVVQTYQSRFGNDPWLVPATDDTIRELAISGAKHLVVVCPGFTADCLETIDEIGNEAAELFKEHGGETLTLVPCLNDQSEWIHALAAITLRELKGWVNEPSIVVQAAAGRTRCPSGCEKQ